MLQPNLDNTLGALFIGLIISAILNGVTLSQAWFYFSSQNRDRQDPFWLKSLVVIIVALDFLHQFFTSYWIYDDCVTKFGNFPALNVLPWSYYGMAYPTGAVGIITQSFYVWRVWKLSGSFIISGAIWSIALAQFGAFLYYVAQVFDVPSAADLSSKLGPYAILVNALGAACDICIAVAMVFYLRRSRTSIKRTNHMLRSITLFTVTTGIISSVCAILVLSMAGAFPGTNIEIPPYFMLTRIYANSFLATLNVRDHLREGAHSSSGIITTSNFIQPRTGPSVQNSTHELDNFPRSKDTQNFTSHEDIDTVISVKVDRITDTRYP